MPWISVVTGERSPPGNRNTSSRMTGWKSQKWSGVESLKGEGIPARNDPSESPSQAVILIIIHFDGTKVVFFFTKLKHSEEKELHHKHSEEKELHQWAPKICWEKIEVSLLFIYLFFAAFVPLSRARC